MRIIKDRHEYMAGHGKCPVVILGNVEERDYELVDLDTVTLAPETAADFTARGLGYIGAFALIDGQFSSAYSVPVDVDVVIALAESYARFVIKKTSNPTPKPSGDSVAWIKKLFALPSPSDRNPTEEN